MFFYIIISLLKIRLSFTIFNIIIIHTVLQKSILFFSKKTVKLQIPRKVELKWSVGTSYIYSLFIHEKRYGPVSFFLSCLPCTATIDYRRNNHLFTILINCALSPSCIQWDVLSRSQDTTRGTIDICAKVRYLVHTHLVLVFDEDGEREEGTAVSPTHNTPLYTQEAHKRSAYLCLTSWR